MTSLSFHLASTNSYLKLSQLVTDCNDKSDLERKSTRIRSINADQITGFHSWRTFQTVVKLTENMRHSRDPKYGSLLRRPRVGNQTWNDFLTLHTRFIDRNDPLSNVREELARVQEKGNVMCLVASQENTSRHSINWLSMKEPYNAIDRQSAPILCPAMFNAATRGNKRTISELEQLLSLGDHKLDRLSPI